MRRRLLLAVGGVSTAVGVGLLVAPGAGRVAGTLPVVGAVLAVAVLGGLVTVARVSTPRERPDQPVPTGPESSVPGERFDRRLAAIPAHSERGADERAAVRDRLRPLVVAHLVRERGLGPETARERIDSGEWTDDPEAAALFTDASPSMGAQLRALLGGPAAFERRVDRVVAVLTND